MTTNLSKYQEVSDLAYKISHYLYHYEVDNYYEWDPNCREFYYEEVAVGKRLPTAQEQSRIDAVRTYITNDYQRMTNEELQLYYRYFQFLTDTSHLAIELHRRGEEISEFGLVGDVDSGRSIQNREIVGLSRVAHELCGYVFVGTSTHSLHFGKDRYTCFSTFKYTTRRIPTDEEQTKINEVVRRIKEDYKRMTDQELWFCYNILTFLTPTDHILRELAHRKYEWAWWKLATGYLYGNELHGLYIDYGKARSTFHHILRGNGELANSAKHYIEAVDRQERDLEKRNDCIFRFTIKGDLCSRDAIGRLIKNLLFKCGNPKTNGMYIPMAIFFQQIAGSPFYRGDIIDYQNDDHQAVLKFHCPFTTGHAMYWTLLHHFEHIVIQTSYRKSHEAGQEFELFCDDDTCSCL